jgi:hypothetical protein
MCQPSKITFLKCVGAVWLCMVRRGYVGCGGYEGAAWQYVGCGVAMTVCGEAMQGAAWLCRVRRGYAG